MKYKKIMFMLVLAIFLFGAASVCASDMNDTVINSEDTSQMGLSACSELDVDNLKTSEENTTLTQTNNDESVGDEIDTEVLGADIGTYSGLSEEIGSGGNIELEHDYYTYDSGSTIRITGDNRVIDGKGAVIDMAGSNIQAFFVSASDVTIKNLIIKNVNCTGNGGAIFFRGTGEVLNCNFTNNTASVGGAVYFMHYYSTVTNCNFINNKASDCGAISMSSGNVTNCNFTNNKASLGGAIKLGEGTVSNCNFINNKASDGGAIMISSGTMRNCNFVGNNATGSGGAIKLDEGTVSNCNFINNKASSGGAIRISSGNVTNCNFENNKATADISGGGGAIYFVSTGAVRNCNFAGNTADNYPDIFCGSELLVLENNTFINNTEHETNSTDLVDLANVKLTLSKTDFTYNAKVQKPTITLTNGVVLKEGVDYILKWSVASPKNVGTYTVTVTGISSYTGTISKTFKINKAINPLDVKAKTVNVKFSAVKKKAKIISVFKVVTFSKKGQGILTYAKVSGNKKITINKKSGKVTIKKGLKKGTYKVKVKIKANGNANYKASAFKTITFKIKIK